MEQHGIRIPTLDQPWTKDEFMTALDTLKNSGEYEYPIDLNAAGTGEWVPYAYSPILQSFGGDLIDRNTFLTAEGVLNGPEFGLKIRCSPDGEEQTQILYNSERKRLLFDPGQSSLSTVVDRDLM